MRKSLIVLPLLFAAAACGRAGPDETVESMDIRQEAPVAADAASEAAGAAKSVAGGPNVNVSAAPGVAFDYRYAFRLLPARVAEVQEQHAQMCEKLGLAHCRITGMRYTVEDEDRIGAMLALKLDPAIARNFGKDAAAVVEKADGMLVDAQITGIDAGEDIKSATRGAAALKDELDRIEAQLRGGGLSNAQRAELNIRANELREEIRQLGESKRASEESLAKTPMVFEYRSGHSIPGLDGGSPIAEALEAAVRSFVTMVSFILLAAGVILPWALLGGLLFWLARRLRPDLFRRTPEPEARPDSA